MKAQASGDIVVGDVLQTKALKVVIQEGHGWLSFKAPEGKAFVLMLMGVEDIAASGAKLDPIKVFDDLGWVREKGQ